MNIRGRLAGIHEYGANITAKNAKLLTIPIHPDAVGKKARSFPDLFIVKSKKGNLLLAKQSGDDIIPYYWLTKSVKIPERSFLRTGHDKNADRIMKQTDRAISLVVDGKMSVDDMLDMLGEQFATAIKEYMGQTKPNSELTIKMKGSSTPLTGLTGALVNSITWEKE